MPKDVLGFIKQRVTINKNTGCWEWTKRNGDVCRKYGMVIIERMVHSVHRLVYELTQGAIPKGWLVLHRCDNPPCCNPSHLFVGTHQDNMDDKVRKGRCATGDANGARIYRAKIAASNRKRARERPETVSHKGELHPCAKLTWEQVKEIRRRHASEKITGKRYAASGRNILNDLAAEFMISASQVKRIVAKKFWV